MAKVRLLDTLEFSAGTPDVEAPLPRIVVWGDEFFIINEEDAKAGIERIKEEAI